MTAPPIDTTPQTKPRTSEIDVFGLTHVGKVRKKNADHFLVASFHRAMQVHVSSVAAFPAFSEDSRGYLMLVADGVGALTQAAEGSEQAIQTVAKNLLSMGEISLQTNPERSDEVVERLQTAMMQAHQSLLSMSHQTGGGGTAATTLTMAFAVWPRMFLAHAGDSRFYRMRDGKLTRLTTDQTMAQMMVEAGAMTAESAEASRLKNVLVSAVGSAQLTPQVEVYELQRGDVSFLCTDGLTKHVTDDEIDARLRGGGSAETICRGLVDLALERGGTDNVTVVLAQFKS